MIKVNEVRLATELAANYVDILYGHNEKSYTKESKDEDEVMYTDDAQRFFDSEYDYFYTKIMECKEND